MKEAFESHLRSAEEGHDWDIFLNEGLWPSYCKEAAKQGYFPNGDKFTFGKFTVTKLRF